MIRDESPPAAILPWTAGPDLEPPLRTVWGAAQGPGAIVDRGCLATGLWTTTRPAKAAGPGDDDEDDDDRGGSIEPDDDEGYDDDEDDDDEEPLQCVHRADGRRHPRGVSAGAPSR